MKKILFTLTIAMLTASASLYADSVTNAPASVSAKKTSDKTVTTKVKKTCDSDSCCSDSATSSCKKPAHPVLMSPKAAAAAGK